MPAPRKIHRGVSMIGMGYHLTAWRHPDARPGGNMALQHAVRVTQAAERGLSPRSMPCRFAGGRRSSCC
jgi:hypothetical protein